ncbi:AgmX/PglI C-terminal domain-containing protein [Agitococcus lubricus]|uniref:Outer membrane transport energization protein TonB n=1 Tax=Agitococcus lubricus TaxID=1077255 RepID=A0A2T5IWC1_9GAMM|nr:AgmX/PglI C-terminal domain-containing protein [Agitococcus lubricus]PTQ88173.1 outer membrane transport energization protein TonB [Agitococcus lubricus]
MSALLIKSFLPWDELPNDSKRAKRINYIALAISIICFVVIPWIKVPPIPRNEAVVPERIARIVERKIELPPPPPKPIEKKESKKDVAEDKPKPQDKPKPVEIKEEPVAKAKPTESQVKAARQKAQEALSSVADDLADLRDMDVVATSKPNIGGALQKDSGAPVGTSRNMITAKAGAGSGAVGAYTGAASSGYGGGTAGGKGGTGNYNLGNKGTKDMKGGLIAGGDGANTGGGGDGSKTRGEGGIGKRTTENIRRVFDQNGGRLNQAYQRALKDDPSMEGTIKLKLTIDPSGKVTNCEVASSDLNNPDLENKIVAMVKGFNFGEDNVEVWKGQYPVNFYPN